MSSIAGQMIAYAYKSVRASTPPREDKSSFDQWEALAEHMLRFLLEARLSDGNSTAWKVMGTFFGTDLAFDSVVVSQQSAYSDGRPDLELSALLDGVEVARLLIELKVRADFTDLDGRHQIARYRDELRKLVDSVCHRGLVVIAPTKAQLDAATEAYKNENRTAECQQIQFRALRWDNLPTLLDAVPSQEIEVRAAVDTLAEFGQVNHGAVLPNPDPATALLNGEIANLFSREFAFADKLSRIAQGRCLRLYNGKDSGTWLMSGLSNNKSCSMRWGVEFDPVEPALRAAWLGHRCKTHWVWARITGTENHWEVPEGDDLSSWWATDPRVKLTCNSDYPGDAVVRSLHVLYRALREQGAALDVPDWPTDQQETRASAAAGTAIWQLLMEARAALTESEPSVVQGQGTFGWKNNNRTIIVDPKAWAEDPASGPFRINSKAVPPLRGESFVHYAARLRSELHDR